MELSELGLIIIVFLAGFGLGFIAASVIYFQLGKNKIQKNRLDIIENRLLNLEFERK